jgi:hypothetical protein
MWRNIFFIGGALLLIIWMGSTIQFITMDKPYMHTLLIAGVVLIAVGCVLHMRVTKRIGRAEEDKSRGNGDGNFR